MASAHYVFVSERTSNTVTAETALLMGHQYLFHTPLGHVSGRSASWRDHNSSGSRARVVS